MHCRWSFLLLVVSLISCALSPSPAPAADAPATGRREGFAPRSPFPLSVKDDRGVTVRIAAAPKRVVSLAPSLTESVYYLGKEGLLVGVTRFCNRPAAAAALPKIGGVADPSPERVLALSPDLVLCTTDGNPKEKVLAIEAAGVPVFCLSPQNLKEVYTSLERLGALLGDIHEGRRAEARLHRRATGASRAVGEKGPSPKVLFAVSASPFIAAGKDTFLDEIVRLAGGTNVAASYSTRYPRLSIEEIVSLSPDVVFLASMAGSEAFPPALLSWKEVPAFSDNAVHSLDGDLVTRPGPGIVEAAEQVAKVLGRWRKEHTAAPGSVQGAPGKGGR